METPDGERRAAGRWQRAAGRRRKAPSAERAAKSAKRGAPGSGTLCAMRFARRGRAAGSGQGRGGNWSIGQLGKAGRRETGSVQLSAISGQLSAKPRPRGRRQSNVESEGPAGSAHSEANRFLVTETTWWAMVRQCRAISASGSKFGRTEPRGYLEGR